MRKTAAALLFSLILITVARGQTPWMRKYPDVSWKYLANWEKTHQWLTPSREGKMYFQKHEVGKALPRLEEAVREGAEDGKIRYELGYCLFVSGDYDRAESELLRAVEDLSRREPDHLYLFNAHYLLGEIYEKKGARGRALTGYGKALRLRPRSPVLHYRRALIFREKGLFPEARSEIEKCLEISEEIPAANLAAGIICLEMEDYPACRRYLEMAAAQGLEEETDIPLAYLAARRGDTSAAIDYYRRALEAQPEAVEPRAALANLLYQKEEADKSLLHFQKLAQLEPDRARWHHNIGVILRELGREEEAAHAFARARELDPGAGGVQSLTSSQKELSLAAREAKSRENYQEAVDNYRRLLGNDPFIVDIRYNLAHTLAAGGLKNRAIREYTRLVRIDPDYATAHLDLGILLFEKNRRSENAARHFRRYLSLRPDAQQAELIRRYLHQIRGW